MQDDDRRFDHHKMHALIGPEREAHWEPQGFLSRLAIQPGQTILDLGSGPGFWTLPLAEITGANGIVWALDGSQEMLDALARRNPPAQVRPLLAELPLVNLPDTSVDWIWAAFVFHEVIPPEKLAAELCRVLKAEGRLAVLEWRPDATGAGGPPRRHRLSVEKVTKYLIEAGFKSVEQTWQDEDNYLLIAG